MPVIEKDNKYYMSEGAGIFYGARKGINTPSHTHEFVEMVYTLKGKCTHKINGESYDARHGDMVIINYNQTHELIAEDEIEYINILIKPEYINMSLGNQENAFALLNLKEFEDFSSILDKTKCKVTFSGDERERIEETVSVISREMKEKSAGFELAIRSQFNLLLIMIFRKMSLSLNTQPTDINDELLNYIVTHSNERLTLEELAQMCSYNTSYFSRRFKNFAGMTFREYLKKVRMEKAKAMLRSTNIEISDIINRTGYTDRTKFFTHFKDVTGVTPLQYRKSKK